MARFFLIVSQQDPERYPYLKHVYSNETVDVIFDRRLVERRGRHEPAVTERRRVDRRIRDVSDDLKQHGWVIVRCR